MQTLSKGSFALGDDDNDKVDFNLSSWMEYINANETIRTSRWWHDDIKLECDDIVMQWILYPFHDNDDIVMVPLIVLITNRHRLVRMEIYFVAANPLCRRRLVRTSP